MRIAFYEPEIAGNVGAILRLGACMGAAVDLIEPMGFEWDDRRVRRTAMDYIDHVEIARHAGFDAFKSTIGSRRLVLFTTKSRQSAYDFRFMADDVLLFGKESAGVPAAVAEACHASAGALNEPCYIRVPRAWRSFTPNGNFAGLLADGTIIPPSTF